MGLILDTTELIGAERGGLSVEQLALQFRPGDPLAVSIISLSELSYGVRRAETLQRRTGREKFLADVVQFLEILPVTVEVSVLAGTLNADLESRGEKLSLADLLIAATALVNGHAVVTGNIRHFSRIDGLQVIDAAAL